MRILVTGSTGMIGSRLVEALIEQGYDVIGIDRRDNTNSETIKADLLDYDNLEKIIKEKKIDRVIHLAALAHSVEGERIEYDDYYKANVVCAENVFKAASNIPVLFISTVDVYGFTKGVVSANSPINPVTAYGKTKAEAEKKCKQYCEKYTVFRFSPVYSKQIKRDIQKRYYLRYPDVAYRIGKGEKFEVLNIELAVSKMVKWCSEKPVNKIHIIKDEKLLDVNECIRAEKENGKANYTIYLPMWIVKSGFLLLKLFTGENKYTYLLNKAVYPLRTR